jgi:tryptophanyl-tRNA synthetase
MAKKILVSGVKPTGTLHIGNYFGAMKQNIELGNSDEYDSYVFMADYHALTSMTNGADLRKNVFDIACAYLACGLDVSKVKLFKQSDVPEHTELGWIFNNVVTVPYLMRAHAYKAHEADNKEVNVGVFDYPVLMAADILMYHADVVPVGSDQKQHIEYARDIAGYYNRQWNVEYFKLPKEIILDTVATVPGVDGRKMSKSYNNVIPLFGTDEELKKAVMGIVTDSKAPEEEKNPDENNVYLIHKVFLNEEENKVLRAHYEKGGLSYKEAKEMLLAKVIEFVSPRREKYEYYQSHEDEVMKILKEGGEAARGIAQKTMLEIRVQVGLD